jgi:hypothetical protein
LRDAGRRPSPKRLPSVFASLLLLGAAGMLTTLGIFLAAQLAGPGAGRNPGANAPAIVRPVATATPAPPTPVPPPTPEPTPLPTAQVFLLPTPTPEPSGSWCDTILGWSTALDHVCHPFGD